MNLFGVLAAIAGLILSIVWIRLVLRGDEELKDMRAFERKTDVAIFLSVYLVFVAASFFMRENGIAEILFTQLFISMVCAIGYVDIKTKYIYDPMLIFYAVILFGIILITRQGLLVQYLISVLIVSFVYGLIYILARMYYKREAFGTGDILFVAVCALGKEPVLAVFFSLFAFYIAAFFLLIKVLTKGRESIQAELAFGPYIGISGLLCHIFSDQINAVLATYFGFG